MTRQVITTPDLELVLPALIRAYLSPDWPDVYVGRTRPDTPRPCVVTVQRSGGVSRSVVLDEVRVAVNVYAATDVDANRLAEAVRGYLESLSGTRPFVRVVATGPTPITGTAEPPRRYFYAELLTRRSE